LVESPKEEGVEEVLRYWPKGDPLNGEPDPEPFDDFFDDVDAEFDSKPPQKI
jgi:hypothetical protein